MGAFHCIPALNEGNGVTLEWQPSTPQKLPDRNVVSSITGFFSGGDSDPPQVSTHWSSESGIIDLFVMLGPRPMDVFRQYGALTGNNNLPPVRNSAVNV